MITRPNPLQEWKNFEEAFIGELRCTPLTDFKNAWGWRQLSRKTAFYKNNLLPRVAERNQQTLCCEFLRCDFTLLNKAGVPMVVIESENAHVTATQEIEKLCAVAAPVKVLLLSCSWADTERAT